MVSDIFRIDDALTEFALRMNQSQEKTYLIDDDIDVIKDILKSKLTTFNSLPMTIRLQKVADLFSALQ